MATGAASVFAQSFKAAERSLPSLLRAAAALFAFSRPGTQSCGYCSLLMKFATLVLVDKMYVLSPNWRDSTQVRWYLVSDCYTASERSRDGQAAANLEPRWQLCQVSAGIEQSECALVTIAWTPNLVTGTHADLQIA